MPTVQPSPGLQGWPVVPWRLPRPRADPSSLRPSPESHQVPHRSRPHLANWTSHLPERLPRAAVPSGGTGRVWVPRSRAARREAPRDPVERTLQKWNVFCKGEDMLNDPGGRIRGLRRAGGPLRRCPTAGRSWAPHGPGGPRRLRAGDCSQQALLNLVMVSSPLTI